ncbi:hypothetical protein KFK09_028886 [Dendrobium nobile]|uniref:BZIP transcription factor n=1 Tax=Dendrobium nobile TaxID=94219 RepID=A0A8T3A2U7_DENNO|nr:hypothetical protein KFK09_028886 [Dendrobium nobile]
MGCSSSKLEELEALALCRKRCDLLAQAIRHRYALADAHAAYADSLRSVGIALHRVLDGDHGANPDSSPVLTLPGHRKGGSLPASSLSSAPAPAVMSTPAVANSTVRSHSRSHSGSHIHFHSDDSDSDDISPLHSEDDSSGHFHPEHHETPGGGGPTFVNLHYAKSNPPPSSISIEQRVGSPEQVQYGSVSEPPSSSSSYPYGYAYPTQNPNSHPYPLPYAYQHNYYGLFGSSSPPRAISQPITAGAVANSKASTSRAAAPPPPSPPRTSTWDYLFGAFDNYYQPYSPSRSSKEVREDEGIPDLEEDEQEVIKEAYGDQKFVASTSVGAVPENSNKSASVEKDDVVGNAVDSSSYHPKPKDEDFFVEKNVVSDELQRPQEIRRSVVVPRRYHNVSEVASDIRAQFEGAAESTKELAKMLEVGKHPYSSKGCASAERMWKVMLGFHQIQRQATSEATHLDTIASGGKLSDSHVNAVMHLELELLRWIRNFSAWIDSQKNFVKSMNGWLVLCLRYEPEVTADGIPPYSPGRIGAPPVFVIFNCWSQVLDRVSEKEVLDAMKIFASNLSQLWRPYDMELRQKMIANREMEKLHKMREREAQVINKELGALNRKLAVTSTAQNELPLSQPSEPGSLQSSLRHVFEAMESFSTNLMKAYEDIHARAEEEKSEEVKGSQG